MRLFRKQSGFTLVEISVAIAILAIGFSTILALQTSYVNSYIQEQARFRATLYARYIMTMIEVEPSPPNIGNDSGSLKTKLKEIGYFDSSATPLSEQFDEEEFLADGWNYELKVESVSLPGADKDSNDLLRRIDLIVSWGESKAESFKLIYYLVNNKPNLATNPS